MFQLTILTLDKVVFSEQIQYLIAPGELGYLEILPHHAALMTTLKKGQLEIKNKDSVKIHYVVSTGLLEVYQNEARLFADSIELNSLS